MGSGLSDSFEKTHIHYYEHGEQPGSHDRKHNQVEVRDSLAVADLDQNGELEFFGFCTSVEGLHLTVWTGRVSNGIRRWHKYHPLFYDVEPSCTEAETSQPYD